MQRWHKVNETRNKSNASRGSETSFLDVQPVNHSGCFPLRIDKTNGILTIAAEIPSERAKKASAAGTSSKIFTDVYVDLLKLYAALQELYKGTIPSVCARKLSPTAAPKLHLLIKAQYLHFAPQRINHAAGFNRRISSIIPTDVINAFLHNKNLKFDTLYRLLGTFLSPIYIFFVHLMAFVANHQWSNKQK